MNRGYAGGLTGLSEFNLANFAIPSYTGANKEFNGPEINIDDDEGY